MQPTTVSPVPAGQVLDQEFEANRVAAMRAMGAKNVDPPLARSAYLKNTKTGLVLPWSQGLAEQRDIMVNCDAQGNTDPAAWSPTINPASYTPAEQDALMQRAMSAIAGYRQHEVPVPSQEMNQPVVFPHDAKPLEEYFAEENAAVVDNLDAALG